MSETQQDGAPASRRVDRGGGWNSADPAWVRAAPHNWNASSDRSNRVGFRCARTALRAPAAENVAGVLTAQRRAL